MLSEEAILAKAGSTERIRDAERTIRLLKQATKAQLIDRGFAGLSIQAILEEAGVSKGALFHHYPTKDHLVAAAFEDILIELADRLHRISRQLRAGRLTRRAFLKVQRRPSKATSLSDALRSRSQIEPNMRSANMWPMRSTTGAKLCFVSGMTLSNFQITRRRRCVCIGARIQRASRSRVLIFIWGNGASQGQAL